MWKETSMPCEEVYQKQIHIRQGCHPDELRRLYELAGNVPEDGVIVEIGSYLGSSSIVMAHTGRQITCIDCFKAGFDGMGSERVEMLSIFKENTAPYPNIKLYNATSKEAVKWIKKPIDLLFIDGDHSLEGVDLDCKLYLPKLKKGGIVVFHDYFNEGFPGVPVVVDYYTFGWKSLDDQWSMKIKEK